MVAHFEAGDCAAEFVDHSNAFMAESTAGRDARDIAFQNVEVGSADGGRDDAHNRIGRFPDLGPWLLLQGSFSGPEVNQGSHRGGEVCRGESVLARGFEVRRARHRRGWDK